MEQGRNLIGGELVSGRATIEVRDPATRQTIGSAAAATPEQAAQAVAAAVAAKKAWARNSDRARLMQVAAAAVEAETDALARLLTREQGKPLAESTAEIGRAARWLRHFAAVDAGPQIIADDNRRHIEVVRRPIGPVAAITPWNFPISLMAWKVAPALAMGNPVIVKPSPFTPLTTQRFCELIGPLFPPGVLAVLAGGVDTARALITHPDIAKIAFTGGTATGRSIMAEAGPALKRMTLELGGNDAAIVLDDADPDAIADRLYGSAFTNGGQVCIAVKRLYVAEPVADALVDRLVAKARQARVGHGLDPDTTMGPINNDAQFERVVGLVESARASGATIPAGGKPVRAGGLFHEPTIVTDIAPDHPLVEEEQFGPVLPVLRFTNLDDAIAMADRGPYGLGASIWTSDPDRVAALAPRLTTGTLWINHHMEIRPDVPFGGAKDSGIGYENGAQVLDEYSQLQVINQWRG